MYTKIMFAKMILSLIQAHVTRGPTVFKILLWQFGSCSAVFRLISVFSCFSSLRYENLPMQFFFFFFFFFFSEKKNENFIGKSKSLIF